MATHFEQIEALALALSIKERNELAHRLIVSLDSEPEGTPEEIAQRVADVEAGRTKWIPAEEVFAEIDALIAAHDK